MDQLCKEFHDILEKTPYTKEGTIFIIETMKKLHVNKKMFKYIFERCYSSNRNPFTTVYHEYVDYLRSGYSINKIMDILGHNLHERVTVEKNYGIYIVY